MRDEREGETRGTGVTCGIRAWCSQSKAERDLAYYNSKQGTVRKRQTSTPEVHTSTRAPRRRGRIDDEVTRADPGRTLLEQ